jgi:hypothetical protein
MKSPRLRVFLSSERTNNWLRYGIVLVMVGITGCFDEADDAAFCDPTFLTIDGECDEPWYDEWWGEGSQFAKDTAFKYLGDFIGVDFKKEVETRIASSKMFQQAREKLRSLRSSDFPSFSIGELMRVLRSPHALDLFADFLKEGGPSAFELYNQAVKEGGPYLDQFRSVLSDYSEEHGLQEPNLDQAIIEAIERHRGEWEGE